MASRVRWKVHARFRVGEKAAIISKPYLSLFQGATVQKIICNADSNSHMDRNKFYVTVSRAKSDVTIFTDDVDKLQKNAQEWCHKVTSDDFIHDLEDDIAENHYKTVGSDYRDEVQRAIDLQHLA